MFAVQAEKLSKNYAGEQALRPVSFSIETGQILVSSVQMEQEKLHL